MQDTSGMKFWLNGSPVSFGGADSHGLKYWLNGSPVSVDYFPPGHLSANQTFDDFAISATVKAELHINASNTFDDFALVAELSVAGEAEVARTGYGFFRRKERIDAELAARLVDAEATTETVSFSADGERAAAEVFTFGSAVTIRFGAGGEMIPRYIQDGGVSMETGAKFKGVKNPSAKELSALVKSIHEARA